jgi:hypothetical protein
VQALGDPDIVHGDDVAVDQARDDPPFVDETLRELRGVRIREDLERYRSIQGLLDSEIHGGHPALADEAVDAIARDAIVSHANIAARPYRGQGLGSNRKHPKP